MQCPGASSLARVIVGGHPLSVGHLQSGPNTLSLGCHGGWRPTEGTKEPSDRVPGICHPPCSGVAAQVQTRSPGMTAEVSSRRLFLRSRARVPDLEEWPVGVVPRFQLLGLRTREGQLGPRGNAASARQLPARLSPGGFSTVPGPSPGPA